MPFIPRTSEDPCPLNVPFCGRSAGPGLALSMKDHTLNKADPTVRDPNAALDDYKARTRADIAIGVAFIALLVVVGLTLWISFDKNVRNRLIQWLRVTKETLLCQRGRGTGGTKSPGVGSTMTDVGTLVGSNIHARSLATPEQVKDRTPTSSPMPQLPQLNLPPQCGMIMIETKPEAGIIGESK